MAMDPKVTITNYLNSNLRILLNHREKGILLAVQANVPHLLINDNELMPNSASQ
jgi:hypothetical protein